MYLSTLDPMSNAAESIYLDWRNNFLTPERFAEYYETDIVDAKQFLHNINQAWKLNNGW
jgi:hypothetical protein